MTPFNPQKHRHWLTSADGLQRLVDNKIAESDHLDYKLLYSLRDPKYPDTVRIDGGAIATAGEGYIVIGIDESDDQRCVAKSIVGLSNSDANALASSIENLLEKGIDPPITDRDCRVVPISLDKAVVVLRVRGRRNYPVSVELEKKDAGAVFYVRERAKNSPLRPQDARLRRRDLAIRRAVPALAAAFAVVFIGILLLAQQIRTLRSHRQLNDKARIALLEVLKQYPGRTVRIGSIQSDLESTIFAQRIATVFVEAGWKVQREQWLDAEGTGVALLGGRKISDGNKGCLVELNTTLYKVAYALHMSEIGGAVLCRPEYSPENPLLLVLRNPESPAGQQFLETYPPTPAEHTGPLPPPRD